MLMHGSDGISLQNKGRLQLGTKIIETASLDLPAPQLISQYRGLRGCKRKLPVQTNPHQYHPPPHPTPPPPPPPPLPPLIVVQGLGIKENHFIAGAASTDDLAISVF